MTTTDYDHALDVAVSRIDLDRPTGGPVWAIIDGLSDGETQWGELADRIAEIGGGMAEFFTSTAKTMRTRGLSMAEHAHLVAMLEVEARTRDLLCAERVNEMAKGVGK